MEKHAHSESQAEQTPDLSQPDFFFHGSGTVQKPHHMTRYLYPSLCGYSKGCIRLQTPVNSTRRSRPQGSGSWGTDGHIFLSISNTPTCVNCSEIAFDAWSEVNMKKDEESGNGLARAMSRMSKYRGNTLLEAGKFQLKKGADMVYVIKRTSVLLLEGSDGRGEERYGTEECRYTIECKRWRDAMPRMTKGREHDHWWTRLHNLFQASFDRAFFHARDELDNVIDLPPPLINWYPRPDIEALVTLYTDNNQPPPSEAKFMGDACVACSRTWFTQSEHACRLKCGHFLCLEDLTQHVDSNFGRGKLHAGETDPETKFFRCIECKAITPLPTDRTEITRADELPWWRWKVSMRRLEKEATEYWLVRLQTLPYDEWAPEIPDSWDTDRQVREIKTFVRYNDAVAFMDVPKKVWAMLPYGFSLDNPVGSDEALALEAALRKELYRLSLSRELFNTKDILDHMAAVGRAALKPQVVQDVSKRLGNPVTPPGYTAYRDFLCEWTARGVLMCPMARIPLLEFLRLMDKKQGRAWWKDVSEVFFDP